MFLFRRIIVFVPLSCVASFMKKECYFYYTPKIQLKCVYNLVDKSDKKEGEECVLFKRCLVLNYINILRERIKSRSLSNAHLI